MISAKIKKPAAHLLAASLLMVTPLLHVSTLFAAGILSTRSVTITDSKQNAVTSNIFRFTIPSYNSVGSIKLEYCENDPYVGQPCTAPAGLNTTSAILTAQTGETGFNILTPPSANKIILTRAPVATNGVPVTYSLAGIVNPSTANKTVYVRMSTHASTDATGSSIDEGSVIFSTSRNISVNGFVPPYLTFCVGVTVSVDCTSANGFQLDFGDLIASNARALTSEYSGATNDVSGFSTSVVGVTMTSGNNVIPALASPDVSRPGNSQFGMNLRANSNPGIGAEPQGSGTSTALGAFASPNQFAFENQVISSSLLPTDFNKFTATYIVNISRDQHPGIYSTTLTYIATASF